MSKHTPGPWKLRKHSTNDTIWNIETPQKSVATTYNDEKGADAHLIASAPELLEACKDAKKYIAETLNPHSPLYKNLEQAIAKAEGD